MQYLWLFKYFFFKCNAIIALTQHTKNTIINWGYKGEIYLETTLFDKNLTSTITTEFIEEKFQNLDKGKSINLLFLSRVEERKGIYELLEAYKKLKEKSLDYQFTLNICGDGSELEEIKDMVSKENIPDITISGFVEEHKKIDTFKKAHIFIFPSYGEGMPNAVLEAMGFGLPVLTTPVGGVNDFFENGVNGHFLQIKSVVDIEDKLLTLINQPEQMLKVSLSNFHKANLLFRSDIVAERVESIFDRVKNS